jgi:hypothetical protein
MSEKKDRENQEVRVKEYDRDPPPSGCTTDPNQPPVQDSDPPRDCDGDGDQQ